MHEFTAEHHGGFVLAFGAATEDILNNSLNSLYLNDIMALFLICVMTVKNMRSMLG